MNMQLIYTVAAVGIFFCGLMWVEYKSRPE